MDRRLFEDIRSVAVLEMEHSGYKAMIMEAERLKGDGVHGLPPGTQLPVVPIACLPGAPESWVQGPGTYVVPVEVEKGLWFDWRNNGMETAVVPSIKGVNPVTGDKLDALVMEQYRDRCPRHKTEFSHGRHCAECGYDWPPQNYVSHPNTLWWDGWRQPDGTVRQFFFTDDDVRDVASAMIGKENTVPAFGFGFFRTKADRTPPKVQTRGYSYVGNLIKTNGVSSDYAPAVDMGVSNTVYYSSKTHAVYNTSSGSAHGTLTSGNISCSAASTAGRAVLDFANNDGFVQCSAPPVKAKALSKCAEAPRKRSSPGGGACAGGETTIVRRVVTKDVAVGAGARIRQNMEVDTTPLSEFIAEPQGLIRLYFVFTEQMREIIAKGGLRPLERKPEGFMADKVMVG